jgi:hypothetical protein
MNKKGFSHNFVLHPCPRLMASAPARAKSAGRDDIQPIKCSHESQKRHKSDPKSEGRPAKRPGKSLAGRERGAVPRRSKATEWRVRSLLLTAGLLV